MGLLLVVQVTLSITPAPHLLGPPPSTSLSPLLPPQPEQGDTLQYLPTQQGHEMWTLCLSHHQVCWLLEDMLAFRRYRYGCID